MIINTDLILRERLWRVTLERESRALQGVCITHTHTEHNTHDRTSTASHSAS